MGCTRENPCATPAKVGGTLGGGNPEPSPLKFIAERCRDLMAGTLTAAMLAEGEGKVQTTNLTLAEN